MRKILLTQTIIKYFGLESCNEKLQDENRVIDSYKRLGFGIR